MLCKLDVEKAMVTLIGIFSSICFGDVGFRRNGGMEGVDLILSAVRFSILINGSPRVLFESIAVRDCLVRRGINVQVVCPLCLRGNKTIRIQAKTSHYVL